MTNSTTKKQYGFTLVELTTSILLLGMFSAVAMPKFVALQPSARYAQLHQIVGATRTAANIIHLQARMENQLGPTGAVTLSDGTVITLVNGYPDSTSTGISALLLNLQIPVIGPVTVGGRRYMEFMVVNQPYAVNRCYFDYVEANPGEEPLYSVLADNDPLASKGPAGVTQCAD